MEKATFADPAARQRDARRPARTWISGSVPGLCGTTSYGRSCAEDVAGAWSGVRSVEGCVSRCERCARCRFVSFSLRNDDCSWYAECRHQSWPAHYTSVGVGAGAVLSVDVDDLRRRQELAAALAKSCLPLRYLHPPKSASSFAPHVWAAACPALDVHTLALRQKLNTRQDATDMAWAQQPDVMEACPCYHWGDPASAGGSERWRRLDADYHHEPLRSSEEAARTVALLRHPLGRAVSHLSYVMGGAGWAPQSGPAPLAARRGAWARGAAHDAALLHAYRQAFERPPREGARVGRACVTRLLLGLPPAAPTPSAAQAHAAAALVAKLAFVGLVECFNESVALFRSTFPASPTIGQLQHYRAQHHRTQERRRAECALHAHGFADPEDEAVYARAAALFHARRRAARIPLGSRECAATVPAADGAASVPAASGAAAASVPPTRYLSYAAHGGLVDQLRQLALARALAAALGRTLVLPPLLRHFEATPKTSAAVARSYHRTRRPALGSVLELASLGVPLAEAAELPPVHALPACAPPEAAPAAPPAAACVVAVAPPAPGGGAAFRRELRSARLRGAPWVHFRRSLFWNASRAGRGGAYLSDWERELRPGPCVRYGERVLTAARAALAAALLRGDGAARYAAVHVRALPEAGFKREGREEWSARLDEAGRDAARRAMRVVYVATDQPAAVLGEAEAVLRRHGLRVASARDVGAAALGAVHADPTTAALLLDLVACLGAERFGAAPRAGLSAHVQAMRSCAKGLPCRPADNKVPYTSSACGGAFERPALPGCEGLAEEG